MSDNTPASSSPPPAPTSPSESVAAPAEVGQVVGTSFDRARWLLALRILRVLKDFGAATLYGVAFGLALVVLMLKGVGA